MNATESTGSTDRTESFLRGFIGFAAVMAVFMIGFEARGAIEGDPVDPAFLVTMVAMVVMGIAFFERSRRNP